MKRAVTNLLATFLLGVSALGQAATVAFNPIESTVSPGSEWSLDIVGLGFVEGLAGGTIDLSFDNAVIEILSVSVAPYWDFQPSGGSAGGTAGLWEGIAFDTFANDPATGDFTIATVNLKAKTVLGTSEISILAGSQFFSTQAQLSPTLGVGTANVVPLPSAVWLLASGVGLFGFAARRSSRA